MTIETGLSFAQIEKKVLNPLGYIPVVSSFSGQARLSYAAGMLVYALGLSAIKSLKHSFTERAEGELDAQDTLALYGSHAMGNAIRAFVEIIGSPIPFGLVIYDHFPANINFKTKELPRGFRMVYPDEAHKGWDISKQAISIFSKCFPEKEEFDSQQQQV